MEIRRPTVGPILGATTNETARLFLRGEVQFAEGRPRRAHAVARIRPKGTASYSAPKYIKLNPNFDMTGVLVFEGLSPSTEYEYQAGWVFSEVDSDAINVDGVLVWDTVPVVSFRTGSATATDERCFVVGSCRYILRLLGGNWFDDRGDKTFGSILEQLDRDRRVDALLMIGDQIYADDLNVVHAAEAVDTFLRRYREAFTTPCLRELMGRLPTYMTLDDHEIEDNWPAHASPRDYLRKYPAAIHSYQIYQLSHSPLFAIKNGRITGTPDHLWYRFSDGCADFFVADTRTERVLAPASRRMISDAQMDALKQFLSDGSGRVKFVVTGVPAFSAKGSDKWDGFVAQRDELLDFIANNEVPRVIFLSGDVHASFVAELVSANKPSFRVLSIVSSSFFWPWPHPPRGTFQETGKIESASPNEYLIRCTSPIHCEDNFTRVRCDLEAVQVDVFSRKGDPLGSTPYRF